MSYTAATHPPSHAALPSLSPERLLTLAAAASGVIALACVTWAGWDDRWVGPDPAWLKPLKFAVSIALHWATAAAALPFAGGPRPGWARLATVALILGGVLELAYILAMAALGEASHYNLATPFTRYAYSLMGVIAMVMVAATAVLGALVLARPAPGRPPWMARALGLGLVVGGILGGVTGMALGASGANHVSGWVEATRLPILGWSLDGGDLRPAHFLGLHAMQGLPLVAWALARAGRPPGWASLVALAFVWIAATLALLAIARV
jgi:hypothetical protein